MGLARYLTACSGALWGFQLVPSFIAWPVSAQSWKHYPLKLENSPSLVFPGVEGLQINDMSDSWFFTGQVTGQTTGKKYQLVTIFDRNDIGPVILNLYQVSIFDYDTGLFNTFTEYDFPGVPVVDRKFHATVGHLDVEFNSSAGNARFAISKQPDGSLRPFEYNINCPGIDHTTKSPFSFNIHASMRKKPVAYGASILAGDFVFYGQPNTTTYWQPGPLITGSLTFNNLTERVGGSAGHIDRQIFPLYSGVFTPTGRQHSHEWRQINLESGIDLAIWRQFDRENGNAVIQTSGTTISYPPSSSLANARDPSYSDAISDDLTVEYHSYAKYPSANYSTLIPPPSSNIYLPSKHIIRSKRLGMELEATYTSAQPVAQLPIEYFEGPAMWRGTFQGKQVSGVGIFESTLGLYRDWELAIVLLNSVSHLPVGFFSSSYSKAKVVSQVRKLNSMVSFDATKDHRLEARSWALEKVVPALKTLTDRRTRAAMLEIASDFVTSLSLIS